MEMLDLEKMRVRDLIEIEILSWLKQRREKRATKL